MTASRRDDTEDEAELIPRAIAVDRPALGKLLALYISDLERWFRAQVCDPNDADDLVQETLIGAFSSWHRFDSTRVLKSWLIGIAKKKRCDFYRRRGRGTSTVSLESLSVSRQPEASQGLGNPKTDDPAEIASENDNVARIQAAMTELSTEQQEIIYILYDLGRSTQEAADTIGVSKPAANSRRFRAVERLKRIVQGPEDET